MIVYFALGGIAINQVNYIPKIEFHKETCMSEQVQGIPVDFSETERGNIWLVNSDSPGDQNAWLRLGGNRWLQISTRLENYPGMNVNVIEATDEALAKHIRKEFGGGNFYARKMNLDGVEVDNEGNLLVPEEEWDSPEGEDSQE